VAEDNEFNRGHVKRLLKGRKYQVTLAADGLKALVCFDAAPRDFDLLILDLQMPNLDGCQVARAVRDREVDTDRHVPIIALTAYSGREDRQRCLAAGMDEYLSKPVRAVELFAAIERLALTTNESLPAARDFEDRQSLLTPATLLAGCGGDAEGLRAMCQDFRVFVPARMAALVDAISEDDAPRLREAAHKLCGLLSAFSATAGDLAALVEDRASRGGHLGAAAPMVDELQAMVRKLTAEVVDLSLDRLQLRAARSGSGKAPAQP
jgi:two-component system, sensor histidine kinase and response regulator